MNGGIIQAIEVDATAIAQAEAIVSSTTTERAAITVTDEPSYGAANEFIATLARRQKDLETAYRKVKDPIVKAGRELDDLFRPLREGLDKLRDDVTRETRRYRLEVDERARKAREDDERKRRDEQRRLDEEAAAKKREADEAAIRAALVAPATPESVADSLEGLLASAEAETTRLDAEHAREVADKAAAAPIAAPAVQTPAKTVRTAAGAVSYRKVPRFEVTEPADVPRDYCMPDEKRIKLALDRDPKLQIPGVRRWIEEEARVR